MAAELEPHTGDRTLLLDPANGDRHPILPSGSPTAANVTIEDIESMCAAYARRDVYGALGQGKLPVEEKVLIAVALVTLVPLRLLMGIGLVLVYYVICRCCTLFCDLDVEDGQGGYGHLQGWRREAIVRTGRFLSRVMLFIMGFYRIRETRCENLLNDESEYLGLPGAIISNHVSYVDVLYHMSSSFPSFVAKKSVARLPLVGIISKCLGCLYVQRESKSSDSKGIAGVVAERIKKSHKNFSPILMIFPEGTTTNGEFLLPFKTGAFLAKVPVLPVILKYPYERFSPAWESISGVRHMILLLCQFSNNLEVTHLPVYYPSQQEKEDPKLYANNVRKSMAVEGNLTLSEIGLAEKRIYLAYLNGEALPNVLHQKDD